MALRALAVLSLLLLPLAPGGLAASELETPTGPVVLTVAGAIANTNRAGFDEFEDGFLNYHEKHFERAAAFDLAMLEALGTWEVTLDVEGWPGPLTFEGPWLDDVLEAVDASGGTITLMALDGYAVVLDRSELSEADWLVALKRDGEYLGIGQRGPLWVVYRPLNDRAPTSDDEARWPWSVFYIEVN